MTEQVNNRAGVSRRALLQSAALAPLFGGLAKAAPKAKIGVTDWNLNLGANPDAVTLAAKLGFDGVQVSFGRKIEDGKMPVDSAAAIAKYMLAVNMSKFPIVATCVDRLHDNGLKSDPQAVKWVHDSIRLTKALQTDILLLPFFGNWAIQNQAEGDYVGDALRELAPEAERAGVILALENTISAESNVRIMERSRSKNVKVYYDVGNSTGNGFDVPKEIVWLGAGRICQFHFKDGAHYLGDGAIQYPKVMDAIRQIDYAGYIVLETSTLPGSTVEADMRKNLAYVRKLVG